MKDNILLSIKEKLGLQRVDKIMPVNYELLAAQYEKTRCVEPIVYEMLSFILAPKKGENVCDFGCGTGNYLQRLQSDFGIRPFGVEPSIEMRKIARNKIPEGEILAGNQEHIPFASGFFNAIYAIDVIHHIKNVDVLLSNLSNVAAEKACLCICTESASQLCEKFWTKYFPEIKSIDLNRFHSIPDIIIHGQKNGWIHKRTITTEEEKNAEISASFIDRVRQKTLSVFQLLSDESYEVGLEQIETDFQAKKKIKQCEGYTFIHFEKA